MAGAAFDLSVPLSKSYNLLLSHLNKTKLRSQHVTKCTTHRIITIARAMMH